MFIDGVTYVELVVLYMLDFDVSFCMYWLHAYFPSIDCRTTLVRFNFQNKPFLECKGEIIFLEIASPLV